MKVEKVSYDNQYPYVIKDCWGGVVNLTEQDLIELKKSIDKILMSMKG